MKEFKKLIIVAAICFAVVSSECYNKCNGHGICDTSNRCVCHRQPGLGLNDKDFTAQMYTGADCSERLCPTGISFIPIVEDEEYNEVVKKGNTRLLFENRDLEGTSEEGDDGTEAPTTPTVAPTTQAPTPSIDDILSNLDTLNKTIVEKPIEVFKPKSSNTPSLGGAMKCKNNDSQTVYVSVSTQSNTTLVVDQNEDLDDYSCQVSYVRKDLSLSGELQFEGKSTTEWDNGEEMRLYGFQYNISYNVNVACVHDEETSQILEESGKVTLLNIDSGKVLFTYTKDKKGTYPQFCYLLTVGVNGDSKVVNVDLVSSELAEMVGKDNNGFVFGKSIENGAVVKMKAEDIKIGEGRDRLLAENEQKRTYVLRLSKNYNKDGEETSTTTPEVTTTTTTQGSEDRVRMLEASSTTSSADFGGYMKYLQAGNKVFIRIKSGSQFKVPQTLHLTKDAESCSSYCKDSSCGIDNKEDAGCYVIVLNEEITDIKNGDTIFFTLTAVGIHPTYECSGVGKCNRQTGQCECLAGYTGDACQILSCPNDCSNHGRCVESSQAIFDGSKTFKGNVPNIFGYASAKKQKIYGCVCDSGYRGPDCSLIECPSTTDPSGGSNNELGGEYRDCSGRGICDYSTGNCACFDGFVGTACETIYSNM